MSQQTTVYVCKNCQTTLPSPRVGEVLCKARGFSYCEAVDALIAAAPELLSALKHLSEILHATGLDGRFGELDALAAADEAIQKAEGK